MARHPPGMEVEHQGSGGCSDPERLASELGKAQMKDADPSCRNSLRLGSAEGKRPALVQLCSETIILGDGNDEPTMQLGR